jgi:AcrR family transcriptional regulator
MPRTRRQKIREATMVEIKETACRLMAEAGTAGLSIRAVARAMDLTPPAIYHYFPSLNDLITALVIDAYNDLAGTLEAAATEEGASKTYGERLNALVTAYRAWALRHPTDFQLVYGNPIPGYSQPSEVTYPPARRSFALLAGLIADAITAGELVPPREYRELPAVIEERLKLLATHEGHDLPHTALYLAAVIWAQIHGRVTLELFNLIQPVIGDTEAFYRYETHIMLKQLGLKS